MDPNGLSMGATDSHPILRGQASGIGGVLEIHLSYSIYGNYRLLVAIGRDTGGMQTSATFALSDAPHFIEVDWGAATAAGANDGYVTLWVDGVQKANLTGIDNDTHRIDEVRLGHVSGIDTNTRGTTYFDAFESRRSSYIGPSGRQSRHVLARPAQAPDAPDTGLVAPRTQRRHRQAAFERHMLLPPDFGQIWTLYYYAGSQRIAQRVINGIDPDVVYYLHGDHLGSTSLVTCGTPSGCGPFALGEEVSRRLYHPYGTVRYETGTMPTDYGFTGQREQDTGLVHMGARFYEPVLGRFISADTIVPEPGNPQALNRYAYSLSNPITYIDPSGHDPLDAEWVRAFTEAHGRAPTDRDRQDRLFSLIYRGSGAGGVWTDDDWAWYSSHRGKLWDGVEQWRNDSQDSGLDRFQAHVATLASYYTDDESDQFVRAFALLYGGIPYSLSWQASATIIATGRRPLGTGLHEGMEGWSSKYWDSDNALQDQTHHYAGLFFMGYFGGELFGGIVNNIRDNNSSYYNDGDTDLGRLAVSHAANYRALNMTPGDLAGLLSELRPPWRR